MTRLRRLCVVALALASGSSCVDPIGGACTLIGCLDGLRVVLDPPVALPYRARLSFPGGQTVAFQCASGSVQDLTGPEIALATCDGQNFSMACTRSPGYCTTHPVAVEVTGADGARRSATVTPQYSESRPNGPRCEPTCSSGTTVLR